APSSGIVAGLQTPRSRPVLFSRLDIMAASVLTASEIGRLRPSIAKPSEATPYLPRVTLLNEPDSGREVHGGHQAGSPMNVTIELEAACVPYSPSTWPAVGTRPPEPTSMVIDGPRVALPTWSTAVTVPVAPELSKL